ncbi:MULTISPECIES: SixA phosphatase family protein [Streptomyces]|uniref:Phosphohistidine phosphatase n=1 Tax=Streptomyces cacaoi TaxID=1898 RepID=A0A4Y3RAJ0_STRCI|nr:MULTISPECIES: histidine phosphatase family protein [Streptomyces]NNG85178.1 histidine phosphatase family protein [Streptomyces cacaoi]QHF94159.1 histidine phosphatase family protein [Streptomyces sp. NHF165]GEB53707.1 phosphohistidine phosphatase [Streptomyces cacaoi]
MSVDVPRSIVLLRHAKADWPQVADHERPLADRGRQEAPLAGEWIAAQGLSPQRTLCSTATRTRETWKLVVQHLPHRPKTVYEERLYEAPPGQIIEVVNETPDEVRDLLVIGHNPGMQAVADLVAGSAQEEARARLERGFPTAAVAVLRFSGPWKSVEPGSAELTAFWTPHS